MAITGLVVYLGLAAGLCTSLTIIWHRGIKPVIRFFKRTHQMVELLLGIDERITVIERNSRQLTNNGGSHMKDSVDRIERKLSEHLEWSARTESKNAAEFIEIYKRLPAAPAGVQVAVETR